MAEKLKSTALELTLSCLCCGYIICLATLASVVGRSVGGITLKSSKSSEELFQEMYQNLWNKKYLISKI
jgi:hypothetical protein